MAAEEQRRRVEDTLRKNDKVIRAADTAKVRLSEAGDRSSRVAEKARRSLDRLAQRKTRG